jgi:hypothetical protein
LVFQVEGLTLEETEGQGVYGIHFIGNDLDIEIIHAPGAKATAEAFVRSRLPAALDRRITYRTGPRETDFTVV